MLVITRSGHFHHFSPDSAHSHQIPLKSHQITLKSHWNPIEIPLKSQWNPIKSHQPIKSHWNPIKSHSYQLIPFQERRPLPGALSHEPRPEHHLRSFAQAAGGGAASSWAFDTATWLVIWNMTDIFPYLGDVIIPTDVQIVQRGSNHQPATEISQKPTRITFKNLQKKYRNLPKPCKHNLQKATKMIYKTHKTL